MEYYRFLHSDTVLPTRFPIGLEKLVKNFGADDFAAFYNRHYYPSNMCVYVAGDVDAADMEAKIQRVFGHQPAGPRDGAKGNDPDILAHQAPVVKWPRRGKIIEHASFRKGALTDGEDVPSLAQVDILKSQFSIQFTRGSDCRAVC